MKKLSFLIAISSLFLFGCEEEVDLTGGDYVEVQAELKEPEVVGVGQTLQVGNTTIKVNKVEEKALVNNGFLNFVPESKSDNFIVVDMTISNSGSSNVVVDSIFFSMIADELKLNSSPLVITDGTYFLYTKIEPNSSQRGKVLFEVPKDVSDLTLQISDMNFGEDKGYVVIK